MMPQPDTSAASPPLIGTWLVSNMNIVPGEEGILVLLADGRCVQFASSITRPPRQHIQRLWFTCVDENTLRFRREPHGSEWLRYIQRSTDGEGEGWTMISDDQLGRHEFPCRPAREEDLPAWFAELLERHLSIMADAQDHDCIATLSGFRPRESISA